jgi:hypothetical protein
MLPTSNNAFFGGIMQRNFFLHPIITLFLNMQIFKPHFIFKFFHQILIPFIYLKFNI